MPATIKITRVAAWRQRIRRASAAAPSSFPSLIALACDLQVVSRMSSQRYARALLSGVSSLRAANTTHQVSRRSHTCAHSRSLTLAAAARQQLAYKESPRPGSGVMAATTGDDCLHLQFSDGRTSAIPYHFLRDNCKCHRCRSQLNTAIHSDFEVAVHPEIIQNNVLGVVVDWSDGHISKYSGEWLHQAAHDLNFCLS